MCGIYGSTIPYSDEVVQKKLMRTDFRGPDYTGVRMYDYPQGKLTLGHNRLAIVDLDARSNQPFDYGTLSIVFNGEIYNFKHVKKELVSKGYEFTSSSDTEVLCAAYLEWGQDCLARLNGMFAFVIFDKQSNILFGARDRLGKKPFYYCLESGFEFSSQISSIQLGRSDISISSKSIARYLAWSNVPDPDSIFNEIKKLRAGHAFEYDLSTNQFSEFKYWDIDATSANTYAGSYAEAKEDLKSLLNVAVKERLFADVPVGVFLSGGIDSSLVAAMATFNSSNKINTFSIKFNEDGFDESLYAAEVAAHLGTNHTTIECSFTEGLKLIEDVSAFYDEPFADSSAIPSMLLAKHTKLDVTVALSGDGGDESFLGYSRYDWITKANRAFMIPGFLRKPLGATLQVLPNYKLKVIGKGLELNSIEDFYLYTLGGLNNSWIDYSQFDLKDVQEKEILKWDLPLVQRLGDFDLKSYLIWDINTKVDRASMSASLEARAPLLDYKVVDFARSLPVDYKFEKGNQKRILKDVLYEYVPKEMLDRPKAGFSMPFKDWFRKDLKDTVLDALSRSNLQSIPGIVVPEVELMIQQHMDGSWNRMPQIWKLLVLQQWLEKNASGIPIK